eukprot:GHVL01010973.1.p1 GENE.GHVL01010973.1~~GHVL01010973.1.p1  ORF type:complete len:1292 (+),score=206.86 GHVL01010973.1:59-3934(+)
MSGGRPLLNQSSIGDSQTLKLQVARLSKTLKRLKNSSSSSFSESFTTSSPSITGRLTDDSDSVISIPHFRASIEIHSSHERAGSPAIGESAAFRHGAGRSFSESLSHIDIQSHALFNPHGVGRVPKPPSAGLERNNESVVLHGQNSPNNLTEATDANPKSKQNDNPSLIKNSQTRVDNRANSLHSTPTNKYRNNEDVIERVGCSGDLMYKETSRLSSNMPSCWMSSAEVSESIQSSPCGNSSIISKRSVSRGSQNVKGGHCDDVLSPPDHNPQFRDRSYASPDQLNRNSRNSFSDDEITPIVMASCHKNMNESRDYGPGYYIDEKPNGRASDISSFRESRGLANSSDSNDRRVSYEDRILRDSCTSSHSKINEGERLEVEHGDPRRTNFTNERLGDISITDHADKLIKPARSVEQVTNERYRQSGAENQTQNRCQRPKQSGMKITTAENDENDSANNQNSYGHRVKQCAAPNGFEKYDDEIRSTNYSSLHRSRQSELSGSKMRKCMNEDRQDESSIADMANGDNQSFDMSVTIQSSDGKSRKVFNHRQDRVKECNDDRIKRCDERSHHDTRERHDERSYHDTRERHDERSHHDNRERHDERSHHDTRDRHDESSHHDTRERHARYNNMSRRQSSNNSWISQEVSYDDRSDDELYYSNRCKNDHLSANQSKNNDKFYDSREENFSDERFYHNKKPDSPGQINERSYAERSLNNDILHENSYEDRSYQNNSCNNRQRQNNHVSEAFDNKNRRKDLRMSEMCNRSEDDNQSYSSHSEQCDIDKRRHHRQGSRHRYQSQSACNGSKEDHGYYGESYSKTHHQEYRNHNSSNSPMGQSHSRSNEQIRSDRRHSESDNLSNHSRSMNRNTRLSQFKDNNSPNQNHSRICESGSGRSVRCNISGAHPNEYRCSKEEVYYNRQPSNHICCDKAVSDRNVFVDYHGGHEHSGGGQGSRELLYNPTSNTSLSGQCNYRDDRIEPASSNIIYCNKKEDAKDRRQTSDPVSRAGQTQYSDAVYRPSSNMDNSKARPVNRERSIAKCSGSLPSTSEFLPLCNQIPHDALLNIQSVNPTVECKMQEVVVETIQSTVDDGASTSGAMQGRRNSKISTSVCSNSNSRQRSLDKNRQIKRRSESTVCTALTNTRGVSKVASSHSKASVAPKRGISLQRTESVPSLKFPNKASAANARSVSKERASQCSDVKPVWKPGGNTTVKGGATRASSIPNAKAAPKLMKKPQQRCASLAGRKINNSVIKSRQNTEGGSQNNLKTRQNIEGESQNNLEQMSAVEKWLVSEVNSLK